MKIRRCARGNWRRTDEDKIKKDGEGGENKRKEGDNEYEKRK
jgi:hypothetical protein